MIKEYLEYFVEYDNENLLVYISGLDEDGFWEEIGIYDEVDDPESFAHGFSNSLIHNGKFSSVGPVEYDD